MDKDERNAGKLSTGSQPQHRVSSVREDLRGWVAIDQPPDRLEKKAGESLRVSLQKHSPTHMVGVRTRLVRGATLSNQHLIHQAKVVQRADHPNPEIQLWVTITAG